MWISLIQNLEEQSRNQQLLTESTYSKTLLEQRWMMKLQDLQTIQTCHCHRMPGKYGKVTSWHAAAFSDSAEPIPHTRPWRPRCQSGSVTNGCPWRTRLSSAPRPRPGNRDRSRLASSSRALPFKSWSLKSGETWHIMTFIWDILADTKFERTTQKSTISFRIYHVDRCHSNIRFIVTKLNVGTWILGSSMRKVLAIEPS